MPWSMTRLDDFPGATDDAKMAAAMADLSLRELKIDRAVVVTQSIAPHDELTVYGAGKFAGDAAVNPVYLQKTTPGPLWVGVGLTAFNIRKLGMYGAGLATDCVSLTDVDECQVISCKVANFVGHGVCFTSTGVGGHASVKCLTYDCRISASPLRSDAARGIYFPGGGESMRSQYDYVSSYSTGFQSEAEATVVDQLTVEVADNGIRISGGDCKIIGGLANDCAKVIVQAGSFYVNNDFMRGAYPSNCVILDPSKFIANWNGA